MRPDRTSFFLSAALVLAACDGSGGSGGGAMIAAPTPSPSPAPAPVPSPSPSPSASSSPNLAGATDGSTLQIRRACSSAQVVYQNGRIAGVGVSPITLPSVTSAQYMLTPDRIISLGQTFYKGTATQQFTLFESLADFSFVVVNRPAGTASSSTYGLTDAGGLCFFAGGLPATSTTLSSSYEGRLDGLLQFSDFTIRLFPSQVTATINPATGTGTLQVNLAGYSNAFSDFSGQIVLPMQPFTANLTVNGTQVVGSSISGLNGYSGTMAGELVGQRGMALAFELHNSFGEVVWGVIALNDGACQGCWDY